MNMSPYASPGHARALSTSVALPFLRRVYSLFTLGILVSIAGAFAALYLGEPVVTHYRSATFMAPPLVAFGIEHTFMLLILFMGAFFGALYARRNPQFGVIGLVGFTFITGLWLAPTLFFVQMAAAAGSTLDASPIRDAFLLTGAAFIGLTSYVFITRKDFSFMGGALSMGLWVVIGASLLGIFVHSAAFSLAISSVVVLLFGGFILYDTSKILRSDGSDAVGAALTLFLDVFNLFVALLNILSSQRNRG